MAGVPLGRAEHSFVGRKGSYLLFEEADPNGSTAFSVFDARDGRKIVPDGTERGIAEAGSLHRIVATPRSLTLVYRRGVNIACSILAEPRACWRSFTHRRYGAVPRSIARLAPPARACARSYGEGKAPGDDPSVIAYEVQVTSTRPGRTQKQARGPLGCTPMP